MHQGINGAGGKHSKGQALQQFGNEHRLIGIHGRTHQSQLGSHAGTGHNRNVGHLAARTAGSRHNNQLALLFQVRGLVIQGIHSLTAGDRQHLGDINHGSAADGHNPLAVGFGRGGQNGVHHHVARLPGTVLFLKEDLAAQSHLPKIGLVNVLIGQDQILGAEFEVLHEFPAGCKLMQRRFE